jgi:class 3 adenylate cyclase
MAGPASDVVGGALLRAFAERGFQATLTDAMTVRVILPDGSGVAADITAWRQHAQSSPPDALPKLAADYADRAAAAFGRHGGRPQNEGVLSAENLRVRIYPDEFLGDMAGALVTRRLAPGLIETVVVDYPDSLSPLNRADLGGGTPESRVFGLALAASIGREPHYVDNDMVNGVPVTHIGGTHRYVNSHVHVLRRHVDPASARYGALVAFPLPEYVLVHAIGGVHLFAAMESVQTLARRLFETGEKPVSPQVYWWRPGRYEQLPEEDALNSGQVPDLRPVGIAFDHDKMSVAAQSTDTNELIDLWRRDHG